MPKIIRIIFILIILAGILFFSLRQNNDNLQLHFLDIGQGDAILIRTPSGHNILIDGGADNLLLPKMAEVLPWWDNTIDYIVISHYHADHMMGLMELLNKYKVGEILVTAHQPEEDLLFQVWQQALSKHNLESRIVSPGEIWQLTNDLSWQVLLADDHHEDFNSNSLILKLNFKEIDILFTGDLPITEEESLLRGNFNLQSEILKIGHHGSKHSSSQEFLQAVQPELCVIQSGEGNKFGHPTQEALDRLEQVNCQVLRNDQRGTISVFSDGQQYWTR